MSGSRLRLRLYEREELMKHIVNICIQRKRIVTPPLAARQRWFGETRRLGQTTTTRSVALQWLGAALATLSLTGCTSPGRDGLPTTPSTLATPSGEQRALLENAPFKGGDSGTLVFLETGCAAGFTPLETHTTGTATLIGAHAFETAECFDNNALKFSGSFTITAASGDTLLGTLLGNATGVQEDGTATYTFTARITGGTGRFTGATGTFSGNGQGNLVTFDEARTFSGTISVPGNHP